MRALPLVLVVAITACPAPAPREPVTRIVIAPIDAPSEPVVPPALEPAQPTLRLPRNFVPTGYRARLEIDPRKADFAGSIAITGIVGERSRVIWLHGQHLAIQAAAATQANSDGSPGSATQVAVTPHGDDLLELRLAQPLEPGTWTLQLEYTGSFDLLNTAGAFKQVIGGEAYVFSQFEAVYARRVFPCVDEPDNKVPWQLTLDVPRQLVAVSNTPVAHETPLGDDRKRVEFEPTRPFPSYLVAFGVGPLELVPAGATRNGTPIRIVTLAGRAADAAWAVKTTPRIVELLEDWFAMPYPYAKLDLMTIPLTVGFGAMENAGLITFTERLMLFDQKHPSRERQHAWVSVAAHELAHQWFGDLVTTAWWDDIWLNEGFANWMQNKILAAFDPAWHDELSPVATRTGALEADSLVSARRIRQPIEKPDDILGVFDRITYNKGASVLTMFETYLGPELFQRGVRQYLHDRAYGSATSTDFVAAISKEAGQDVGPAFASFLEHGGAPELTATLACEHGKARVTLAQHRYARAGSKPLENPTWLVPSCVVYEQAGKRAQACTLLAEPTGAIDLATKTCPRWLVPNAEGHGYYRSTYTAAQLASLRDEAWPALSWNERLAIFYDVADEVNVGRLPLAFVLSLVPDLLAGDDRFTVGRAVDLAESFDALIPDELRPKYEWWLRATFGPGALKLGVLPKDSDDLDTEATRGSLLHLVAGLGREPKLIADALAAAEHWHELPQALRGLVLAIAVNAKPALFERVLHDVATEPDRAHRTEMYAALGAVRDPVRQLAALQLVLDPKLDIRETLGLLFDARTEPNRVVAQQFFRDHADAIFKRMPADETSSPIAGTSALFTASCDAGQRDAVVDYVTRTFGKLKGGERAVKQNIEAMDQCIARRQLLDPELRGWLMGVRLPKPAPVQPPPPPQAPRNTKKKHV